MKTTTRNNALVTYDPVIRPPVLDHMQPLEKQLRLAGEYFGQERKQHLRFSRKEMVDLTGRVQKIHLLPAPRGSGAVVDYYNLPSHKYCRDERNKIYMQITNKYPHNFM